jgi:hypothetical protein
MATGKTFYGKRRPEELRSEYGALFDLVLAALHCHDLVLIGLLGPAEYEPEVTTILPALSRARSQARVEAIVREEFRRWFGARVISGSPDLTPQAADLWALWTRYGEMAIRGTLPALAALHRLHETAALWRLLMLDQTDLLRRLSIALDDGFESPAFRELVKTPDLTPVQSAGLMEEGLRAWFLTPPDADTVRWWLVGHWASQIRAGEIDPHEGANRIASLVAGTALLESKEDTLKELVHFSAQPASDKNADEILDCADALANAARVLDCWMIRRSPTDPPGPKGLPALDGSYSIGPAEYFWLA